MSQLVFRPKKSLGQNFLIDENIARKTIRLLNPRPDDIMLEIGPGFGVLTKHLIGQVGFLVAIELDRYLVRQLYADLESATNLALLEGDFLKYDLGEAIETYGVKRIIGNIPYHITSQVIFKALQHCEHLKDLTLMIQKEVARRIVASPRTKDYGILSVFSQIFAKPVVWFNVAPTVFRPQPEVSSALVNWNFENRPESGIKDFNVFDAVVHKAFQQRRKMLRNSLRSLIDANGGRVEFNLEQRPEELSPQDFVRLSNLLS